MNILLTILIAIQVAITVQSPSGPNDFNPSARKGVHGMIVLGDKSTGLYMSHIPMFNLPHDVQVLFSVDFTSQRKSFNDRTYTFKPLPFSLDDLIIGKIDRIKGKLYDGNFEAGGKFIGNIDVTIKGMALPAKVLVSSKNLPSLTYKVVGNIYLIHPISHSRDFDQILVLDKPITVTEVVLNGVPNEAGSRLNAGDTAFEGAKVLAELSALEGPDFTSSP